MKRRNSIKDTHVKKENQDEEISFFHPDHPVDPVRFWSLELQTQRDTTSLIGFPFASSVTLA